MSKTAIATDSNSGISQSRAKKLGVFVLPMSFYINEQQYREEIDISQKDFYKLISESKTTVSTSQPSPAELTDFWRNITKTMRHARLRGSESRNIFPKHPKEN